MEQNIKICYSWIKFSKVNSVYCLYHFYTFEVSQNIKIRSERTFLSYKQKPKDNTVSGWVLTEMECSGQSIYYGSTLEERERKSRIGPGQVWGGHRPAKPTGRSLVNLSPALIFPLQSVASCTYPEGCTLGPGSSLQVRHPWSC